MERSSIDNNDSWQNGYDSTAARLESIQFVLLIAHSTRQVTSVKDSNLFGKFASSFWIGRAREKGVQSLENCLIR